MCNLSCLLPTSHVKMDFESHRELLLREVDHFFRRLWEIKIISLICEQKVIKSSF